jgi:hypothetical protein
MRLGPFMSYKSIFKRKNRVYKIGDIKIPWGITLDQFFAIAVVVIFTLLIYLFVPFLKYISIVTWIMVVVLETVLTYVLVGKIDFRGMGLVPGLISIVKWLFEPKRTLLDEPLIKLNREYIHNTITSGFQSDESEEILHTSRLKSVTIEGSVVVTFHNDFMYVRKTKKPYKKPNFDTNASIRIDPKKKKALKLVYGIHTFRKSDNGEWQYIQGGVSTNEHVPNQPLDGEFNF